MASPAFPPYPTKKRLAENIFVGNIFANIISITLFATTIYPECTGCKNLDEAWS